MYEVSIITFTSIIVFIFLSMAGYGLYRALRGLRSSGYHDDHWLLLIITIITIIGMSLGLLLINGIMVFVN